MANKLYSLSKSSKEKYIYNRFKNNKNMKVKLMGERLSELIVIWGQIRKWLPLFRRHLRAVYTDTIYFTLFTLKNLF